MRKQRKEVELNLEKWSKAFKMFINGKKPIDLVVEGILTPDEAESAYDRFLIPPLLYSFIRAFAVLLNSRTLGLLPLPF